MAIIREEIKGTKIINDIQSSNIKHTEYDTETKSLEVIFNNDLKYLYEGVPHQVYTQFRMSESQGKFFSTKISKSYPYKKVWLTDIYNVMENNGILKSFDLQDDLNPKIWEKTSKGSYILSPKVREKLLEIAYEFIEPLKLPKIKF